LAGQILLCWGIWTKGLPHIQRHPDTVISDSTISCCCNRAPAGSRDVWPICRSCSIWLDIENVRVKDQRACTMCTTVHLDDYLGAVLRVIDAFGLDRCMWGTDWTRTIGMLTYEQGVAPFRETKRLSESDKARLMGGTLQKVYKW